MQENEAPGAGPRKTAGGVEGACGESGKLRMQARNHAAAMRLRSRPHLRHRLSVCSSEAAFCERFEGLRRKELSARYSACKRGKI